MSTTDSEHSNICESRDGPNFYRWNPALLREFKPDIFSPELSTDYSLNRLGRGAAAMFPYRGLNVVLRHYQRGGLVRFFNRDFYPFFRLRQTRMWREFDLLLQLQVLSLPAPVAVAARCQKMGPGFCRGDLITQTIPNAQTLAEVLQHEPLEKNEWRALGALLARFHSEGVYHADLNANNILQDHTRQFYLLDFDRGELRTPDPAWQAANLGRLLRSLHKMQKRFSRFYFEPADWAALLSAYSAAKPS